MPVYDRFVMSISELEATHRTYEQHRLFWDFLLASYEGLRALVAGGFAIRRNERESYNNYMRRIREAYGFNYSSSIVEIFNMYLFKSPAKRDMGVLSEDKQWKMFETDCNLYGDNFLVWLLESQRWAGVLGHVGILIDKSSRGFQTAEEELNAGVYPYVARYFPQNILDWEYKRDENNRPYLSYVKVRDDDGYYRIWTSDYWTRYRIPEDLQTTKTTVTDIDTGQVRGGVTVETGGEQAIESDANGDNPFYDASRGRGEIPFVWLYNIKSKTRPIGVSDIKDVAYIDRSIITNLSEGEEVITYGAFPMMRKPMEEMGKGASGRGGQDDAGVTAILEFDPEHPESKADWLEAAVAEPIDAILRWIERKASEIYRTTNIGGMAATEIQSQARSGVALKSEFQLLNGKLISKGNNVEESELSIKRYWCMWQNRQDAFATISVEWPETYDIENLAEDLANALTSKTLVNSKSFLVAIQKKVARAMLPNADNKLLAEIDGEIEDEAENPKPPPINVAQVLADNNQDEEGDNPETDKPSPQMKGDKE